MSERFELARIPTPAALRLAMKWVPKTDDAAFIVASLETRVELAVSLGMTPFQDWLR